MRADEPLPGARRPLAGADVPGAILAGGESRRFGAPKALARVHGRTIVERVRDALRAVTADVRVVANRPEWFSDLDVPLRPDAVPGIGAVGGILTALRWAAEDGAPGVLAVACDLPFVTPGLLRDLLVHADASGADAVVPASDGPHGYEPLCAWYGVACLPAVERMVADGERRAHRIAALVRASRLPAGAVGRHGEASTIFFNVNTVDHHREAQAMAAAAAREGLPPVVAIVGRKNSGKTTLTVAVAAELKRRGRRVATIKHGHHAFETDQPGKDSWRHFHEGGAEAVVMAGAGKVALVMRTEGEPDPVAIVRDFYAGRGYHIVLVEGYKHGPFPRVEVFRRALHEAPLHDLRDPAAAGLLALVTDDASVEAECPVIRLDADPAGGHVSRLADLLEAHAVAVDDA